MEERTSRCSSTVDLFVCATAAYTDLESERWLLSPVALTEDRILWTAHKVCNEYLGLFIFAELRYFNVSSAFSLRATRTRHAVPTHAIAEGGGAGWGRQCRQVAFAPQWALFICAAPLHQSKKAISKEDIWTSDLQAPEVALPPRDLLRSPLVRQMQDWARWV